MLRSSIITLFFLIAACFLNSCSSNNQIDTDSILAAKINDYQLTKDEFNKKLRREVEYNNDFKITANAKKEFLDTMIKKELLIQEAREMGLDKKESFKYAIERYWKATLIKHLMEIKNQEIFENVMVSDKEINLQYKALKSLDNSIAPLETIEKQIAKELVEEKRTKALELWITTLHDQAKIKINSDFINR